MASAMLRSSANLKRTRSFLSTMEMECSKSKRHCASADIAADAPFPAISPFKEDAEDSVFLAENNDQLSPKYHLPKVISCQVPSGAFRSISAVVLKDLLNTLSEEEFKEKYYLVDCRYPYEYFGGHIKYAQNHFNPTIVADIFYPHDEEDARKMKSRIPIFYCEFSQKRGPAMGHLLRDLDRKINVYPKLDFPEIYLLDRGYSNFFETEDCKNSCEPMHYVKMLDDRHKDTLRRFSFHRSKSSSQFPRTRSSRCILEERQSTCTLPSKFVCKESFSISSELNVSMSAATASPISRCRSRGTLKSSGSGSIRKKLSFDSPR